MVACNLCTMVLSRQMQGIYISIIFWYFSCNLPYHLQMYNEELAGIAQAYSQTCQFQHSTTTSSPSFSFIGENIYLGERVAVNYTSFIVDSWANAESPNYDFDSNTCNRGSCGHYTQASAHCCDSKQPYRLYIASLALPVACSSDVGHHPRAAGNFVHNFILDCVSAWTCPAFRRCAFRKLRLKYNTRKCTLSKVQALNSSEPSFFFFSDFQSFMC